jgi:MSHA pilin protein MshD
MRRSPSASPSPPRRIRRVACGFSIVEAVVCVLVTGIMVVAATQSVSSFARANHQQKNQARASALARRLITEIEQSTYVDPANAALFGPEPADTNGSRSLFKYVNEYHNWTDSPPQNRDGTVISGYTGWSRSVAVTWVDAANPVTVRVSESGLKRITVTVTDPTGRITTLAALRAAKGAFETKTSVSTPYTSWIGINLQLGSDPASKADGAAPTLGLIP